MQLIKKTSSIIISRNAEVMILSKTAKDYPNAYVYAVSMLPPEYRCPIFTICTHGPCHSNYAYSTYFIYKDKVYTIRDYKPYMTDWSTYEESLQTLIDNSEYELFLNDYVKDNDMKEIDYEKIKNIIKLFYLDDLLWFIEDGNIESVLDGNDVFSMNKGISKPKIHHTDNGHEYEFFTYSVNTTEIRRWNIIIKYSNNRTKIDTNSYSVAIDPYFKNNETALPICQKPVKER